MERKSAVDPNVKIDAVFGVVEVNDQRLDQIRVGTKPWYVLLTLARASGRPVGRDVLYSLCSTRRSKDPDAAVRDGIRRLREVLDDAGLNSHSLVRRSSVGHWRLVARSTVVESDVSRDIGVLSGDSSTGAVEPPVARARAAEDLHDLRTKQLPSIEEQRANNKENSDGSNSH